MNSYLCAFRTQPVCPTQQWQNTPYKILNIPFQIPKRQSKIPNAPYQILNTAFQVPITIFPSTNLTSHITNMTSQNQLYTIPKSKYTLTNTKNLFQMKVERNGQFAINSYKGQKDKIWLKLVPLQGNGWSEMDQKIEGSRQEVTLVQNHHPHHASSVIIDQHHHNIDHHGHCHQRHNHQVNRKIAIVKKCMAFFLYGNFCRKIAIPHQTVDMNDCFPTSGETQTLVDMDIKITSIAHKSERKLRLILILLERYICWQFSVAHYLFQNDDLLPKCNGASVGSFSQEREILFWKGLNVITASMNPV